MLVMSCKYSKLLIKNNKNDNLLKKVFSLKSLSSEEHYSQYYNRKLYQVKNVRLNDKKFVHISNINKCRSIPKLSQNEVSKYC